MLLLILLIACGTTAARSDGCTTLEDSDVANATLTRGAVRARGALKLKDPTRTAKTV